MIKHKITEVMKELQKIDSADIKLLFIENCINALKKEMEINGESDYINDPSKAYEDVKRLIPKSDRVKFYNELIFLKDLYN